MYQVTLLSPSTKAERPEGIIHSGYEGDYRTNIAITYFELLAKHLAVIMDAELKIVGIEEQDEYIRDGLFYIDKDDTAGADHKMQLVDTSMIVTNIKTKKYFYVDYQDGAIHCREFARNKNCFAIIIPQHKHIYEYMGTDMYYYQHSHKFHPFGFFPSTPGYSYHMREEIQKIRRESKLIPKMYFSGNFYSEITYHNPRKNIREHNRAVVETLHLKYNDWIDTVNTEDIKKTGGYLSKDDYFRKVASYAVPLDMPGHPWSHREQEFWGLGIPTLGNTYTCPVLEPLLPNIHYIDAGTRGKDTRDREVEVELAADLIYKRFKEVYNNRDYLNFVSDNIMKRYDRFQDPTKGAEYMLSYIKTVNPNF